VHPTWYDTASRVVLEALASGAPAITTARDGNADLAVEAGGAALDDPGDDAALARAIGEVAARVDRERARAVAERLPEERMLDEVVEALRCASSS
jgi:glycosyltransferase involved in cell wall biosynthesis